MQVTYLSSTDAAALDAELFSTCGFEVAQLVELAGKAVAAAIVEHFGAHGQVVAVLCGPGNNGSDGLVCARYLKAAGMHPEVFLARAPTAPLHRNLIKQCAAFDVPVLVAPPHAAADTDAGADALDALLARATLAVDAVFGFSVRGTPRPPYAHVLATLTAAANARAVRVIAVDLPSTCGDADATTAAPPPCESCKPCAVELLVSLTAPKPCACLHTGAHFLAGNFVPPSLRARFGLESMHRLFGTADVVRLE